MVWVKSVGVIIVSIFTFIVVMFGPVNMAREMRMRMRIRVRIIMRMKITMIKIMIKMKRKRGKRK